MNYIIAIVLLLLFVPIKVIYVIFALALFLIPHKKITTLQKRKLLIIGGSFLIIALSIFLKIRGHEIMRVLSGSNADPRSEAGMLGTAYSLSWVIHHPYNTFLVFCRTLIINTDRYITKCFIGENYDAYVPSVIIFPVISIYLIISMASTHVIRRDRYLRITAASIFFIGSFFVFSVFLFIFSVPDLSRIGEIGGVQGRYFLPFVILILFFLKKKIEIKEKTLQKLFIALLFFTMLSILFKMSGIITNL